MRIIIALLALCIISYCKKSASVPVTLSVKANNEQEWKTSDVTTNNEGNGVVSITGATTDGSKLVVLNIATYRDGRATYTINQTYYYAVAGTNSASYQDDSVIVQSITGIINVTSDNTNSIGGNFAFDGPTGHVSGTFTAAKP